MAINFKFKLGTVSIHKNAVGLIGITAYQAVLVKPIDKQVIWMETICYDT